MNDVNAYNVIQVCRDACEISRDFQLKIFIPLRAQRKIEGANISVEVQAIVFGIDNQIWNKVDEQVRDKIVNESYRRMNGREGLV